MEALLKEYKDALEKYRDALKESQDRQVQINIQALASNQLLQQQMKDMQAELYFLKKEWAGKVDNYTTGYYLLVDAVDKLSTRDVIIDIAGEKPKVVYDSIKPKNTVEEQSILESMNKVEDPEDVEDEHTKMITIEVETEKENKDGTITYGTETKEVEVALTTEEVAALPQKEEDIIIETDIPKGVMSKAVMPTILDYKPKPVNPVNVTVYNSATHINTTITPKWIAVHFYRQDLTNIVGITNLPEDTKKAANSGMKRWLNNNIAKDPEGMTGAMQRGLPHVKRSTAVLRALANYRLINGESFVGKQPLSNKYYTEDI